MKRLCENRLFLLLLVVLTIVGCAAMQEKRAKMLDPANLLVGASYVGDESCKGCHQEKFKDGDFHSRIKDFEAPSMKLGCEGCHGPGSLHAAGQIEKIIAFKGDSLDFTSVCMSCHQSGKTMSFEGSSHHKEGLECHSCHKMHRAKNEKLLKDTELSLCYSCHQNVRAKMSYPSHHPVKEDKMSCSSCHNVHADNKGLLNSDEGKNELCLSCHRKYQGPFVYEHAPVIEDCMNCHDAHGTVSNNLLKQNEPFVCLQCHEAHFHTLRISSPYDLKYLGVQDPYNSNQAVTIKGDPQQRAFQKAFLTKCTQCHTSVHGSDLPSQGTTSHGKNLTR